jgi:transcriptional regulator with XRE-family HTH domain
MTGPSIGSRIATHRRRRGLSQVALAGLVGRSESWLSQVERGARTVDSLSVLRELARVLRVDLDDLAGPALPKPPVVTDIATDRLAAAETALFGRTNADRVPAGPSHIAELHTAYQRAEYAAVIDALPTLIEGLDPTAPPALLAAGYTLVAKAFAKFGSTEAQALAADRAWAAAERGEDARDIGAAVREVARALHRGSRRDLAESLAVSTAERIGTADDPATISVCGSLWLLAAVIAARDGKAASAARHLDEASVLARALGEDANHYWTAFGPTNVAVHRVSVAVELGDVESAAAAAAAIDLDAMPPVLRSRRTQVQLDLAWAQSRRRNDADAIVALLEVERAAPAVTRYNAVAVDTIRALLARARGAHRQAVVGLAERAGISA